MTKQEKLQLVLETLRSSIPEIRGALVASTDGLPIAKSFSDGVDVNRVAAMAATALGLGKRISDTLGTGELIETSVTGSEGKVLIYTIGKKGVLAVVAQVGINMGLLNLEARDAAADITIVL